MKFFSKRREPPAEIDEEEMLRIFEAFEESCGGDEPNAHYLWFGQVGSKRLQVVPRSTETPTESNF